MIKPWLKEESRKVGDFRIFTVRSERKKSPRTGRSHEFYVIDSVDWVNIIGITPTKELILIEQFRHGTETVELEIPGGIMDPGEVSPVATGVRELREETGYEGEDAQVIGKIAPNPAIMSNTCYTVLIRNCQLKHPVQFDSGEDLTTRLVPMDSYQQLVYDQQIRHSMVVVALYHFDLWRKHHPDVWPS